MEVLYERVAGLDIGKATLVVCVRTPGPGGWRSETRTYPTTTRALGAMRDWLLEQGVTIAAIESTSTYWKAPFYCLEEVMDTWLVNAAHIKAIRRPKTAGTATRVTSKVICPGQRGAGGRGVILLR